ncbi:hypothetical protein GCM10010208_58330 [Actinomadura livida]|nr:hypothetical protein GCM10010208_58330 [Actinomadura livida]
MVGVDRNARIPDAHRAPETRKPGPGSGHRFHGFRRTASRLPGVPMTCETSTGTGGTVPQRTLRNEIGGRGIPAVRIRRPDTPKAAPNRDGLCGGEPLYGIEP